MAIGCSRFAALGAASMLALLRTTVVMAGEPEADDIVESIDQDAPAADAGPAEPAPAKAESVPEPAARSRLPAPSASPERFELHGWARQTLELGLSKPAPDSSDTDATTVPYDQLAAKSQLFIRARYSRASWFEANVSGALSYSLLETAPAH